MKIFTLLSIFLCSFAFSISSHGQTAGLDQSVLLSARAYDSPPRITLKWWRTVECQGFTISRKKKRDANFQVIVPVLSDSILEWTDFSVEAGQEYEYKVFRYGSAAIWGGPKGWGYISSGVKVDPDPWKGNLLLLVDSTLVENPITKNAIWQWKQDVSGEGWEVFQLSVLPTETVVAVRQKLMALNKKIGFRSLFILGGVPIPYSGSISPDDHADHSGAWPTDNYYGDTASLSWPDQSINLSIAADPRNRNIPGDGKFDPSSAIVHLELGRVDMRKLTIFNLSEAQLIRRYLIKNHKFRTARIRIVDRAMHDDQATGLNFGATAWRGYSTLCRNWVAPISPYGPIGGGSFRTATGNHDYLWSGSWGPGSYQSVGNNYSQAFATDSFRTVFTAFIGSYSGDWDTPNNFLKSSLANKGPILTTCWSGRPFWYFHHMGMGECIGYAARLTTNNYGTYETGPYAGFVHIELLGDPTLKLHPMAKVNNIITQVQGNRVRVQWTALTGDTTDGYHVFKKHPIWKRYYKISKTMVTGTQFIDTCLLAGQNYYMVRPVRMERSNTGTYYNYGTGTIDTVFLSIGNQAEASPTLRVLSIQNIPSCPSMVQVSAETTGTLGPHYFRWYLNDIFVDTSILPTKMVFFSQRNNTIQCELVRTGTCAFPETVWAKKLNVQLPLPLDPVVNLIPRGEVCKFQSSQFKANVINYSSSNFSYQWYKNNQLLPGEVASILQLTLDSTSQLKVKVRSIALCGHIDSTESNLSAVPLDTIRPTLSTELVEADSCSLTPPWMQISVLSNINTFRSTWYRNGYVHFEDNVSSSGTTNIDDLLNGDIYQLRIIPRKNCTTIDTLFSSKYTSKVLPSGDPIIVIDSAIQFACLDQPFQVRAIGEFWGTKPWFQWFKNGILLPSDTNSQVTLSSIQQVDSLKVRVVSNHYCRIESWNEDTTISLGRSFPIKPVVVPNVQLFSDQPSNGVCEGKPIRFTVQAGNKGNAPTYFWSLNDSLIATTVDSFLVSNNVNNSDSLFVTLFSAADCAVPATVQSQIIRPLILPLPIINVLLQQNEFSVLNQPGTSYQWLRNGIPIAGAFDSSFLATDSGFYSVIFTNSFACSDTSTAVYYSLTSVPQIDFGHELILIPNPASDLIFVRSQGARFSDFQLRDAQGKLLPVSPASANGAISISQLPNGFYTLSVQVDGIPQMKRFIKQR